MSDGVIQDDLLARILRDAISQKRVIKWGYVRHFGGPYPAECDTVAAHSSSVTVLAIILATECGDELRQRTGSSLSLEDVALMATFHDFGEGRSGDTGAMSYSVRGVCNLHSLEREGLEMSLAGLRFKERGLRLWDDYRAYRTPEALLVHMADNLEGLEKALHAARGAKEVMDTAIRVFGENLEVYRRRKDIDLALGTVADYLVSRILIPGVRVLCAAYGVDSRFTDQPKLREAGPPGRDSTTPPR